VVLDGDDPDGREVLSHERPYPLRVLAQPRRGAGPARNLGAANAGAALVLYLNDDTRPEPACLLAHLRAHREHGPCMTAGHIAWDPAVETTPYMSWLAPRGHQFNFERLTPGAEMPWDAVWGTNLCAPAAWVLDEPFDPAFPNTCLEDSEWAFRQYRRGRRAFYVSDAVVLHDHRYTGPADFRGRARAYASAARYVARKHPALAWRFLVRPTAAAAARFGSLALPFCWRRETLWDLDFRLAYVRALFRPRSELS